MELTTYYPVKWFDYELPDGERIRLKLQWCSPNLYQSIQDEFTTMKMSGKGRGKKPKPVVDQMKVGQKVVDHILQDWEGVTFNGDTACTKEAKLWLISNDTTADIAVWIAAIGVNQKNFTNIEDIVKNLERSSEQNGNGSSPVEETSLKSIVESV